MTQARSTVVQAAEALLQGEAAIFPTDTVYGLGVAVGAVSDPQVLYHLKERDYDKPIAWLVSDSTSLDYFGVEIPAFAHRLAKAYWPGALTLIVKANERVPVAFQSQAGTIGLRMPNNAIALAIIRAVGSPLATTSANFSGSEASRSLDDLDPAFVGRVGVVVADNDCGEKSGVASTVVDCTQSKPVVIRQGELILDKSLLDKKLTGV